MSKLSMDENIDLEDLLYHEGMKGLLKEIDLLVDSQINVVLSYNLSSGSAEQLAYAKARVEGAQKLSSDLRRRIEQLKRRGKDSPKNE